MKPKTIVVKEASGKEVVTAPDYKIKPVVVEKPKPVVLKKDVNLKGEKLESDLDV